MLIVKLKLIFLQTTVISESNFMIQLYQLLQITSLILSLRKKEKLKVRQPLAKVLVPSMGKSFDEAILAIKTLVLNEVNVKVILKGISNSCKGVSRVCERSSTTY